MKQLLILVSETRYEHHLHTIVQFIYHSQSQCKFKNSIVHIEIKLDIVKFNNQDGYAVYLQITQHKRRHSLEGNTTFKELFHIDVPFRLHKNARLEPSQRCKNDNGKLISCIHESLLDNTIISYKYNNKLQIGYDAYRNILHLQIKWQRNWFDSITEWTAKRQKVFEKYPILSTALILINRKTIVCQYHVISHYRLILDDWEPTMEPDTQQNFDNLSRPLCCNTYIISNMLQRQREIQPIRNPIYYMPMPVCGCCQSFYHHALQYEIAILTDPIDKARIMPGRLSLNCMLDHNSDSMHTMFTTSIKYKTHLLQWDNQHNVTKLIVKYREQIPKSRDFKEVCEDLETLSAHRFQCDLCRLNFYSTFLEYYGLSGWTQGAYGNRYITNKLYGYNYQQKITLIYGYTRSYKKHWISDLLSIIMLFIDDDLQHAQTSVFVHDYNEHDSYDITVYPAHTRVCMNELYMDNIHAQRIFDTLIFENHSADKRIATLWNQLLHAIDGNISNNIDFCNLLQCNVSMCYDYDATYHNTPNFGKIPFYTVALLLIIHQILYPITNYRRIIAYILLFETTDLIVQLTMTGRTYVVSDNDLRWHNLNVHYIDTVPNDIESLGLMILEQVTPTTLSYYHDELNSPMVIVNNNNNYKYKRICSGNVTSYNVTLYERGTQKLWTFKASLERITEGESYYINEFYVVASATKICIQIIFSIFMFNAANLGTYLTCVTILALTMKLLRFLLILSLPEYDTPEFQVEYPTWLTDVLPIQSGHITVGDKIIVMNYSIATIPTKYSSDTDPDQIQLTMRTKGFLAKYKTHSYTFDCPQDYYWDHVSTHDGYDVVELTESIYTTAYRQMAYTCVKTGSMINAIVLLFDMWTVDITNFFTTSSIYNYSQSFKRQGHYIIDDSTNRASYWHINCDNYIVTHINCNAYDRLLMQTRVGKSAVDIVDRTKSAISSYASINGLEVTVPTTIALLHVMKFIDNDIICNSSSRPYQRRFCCWCNCIAMKYMVANITRDTHKHKRMCFRTDCYKTQKLESVIHTTNDACGQVDQYWYDYAGFDHSHITYPKNCIDNGHRAIANRQNCHILGYDGNAAKLFTRWVKQNAHTLLPVGTYRNSTHDEWCVHLKGQKRKQAVSAIESNTYKGVIGTKTTDTKAHIKIEATDLKIRDNTYTIQQPIDPRVISARSDEYNVIGGPIIADISKILSSMWSYRPNQQMAAKYRRIPGITYYSSGHNKLSAGEWFHQRVQRNNIFYNTDYKRFDASTSQYLLRIEHEIYKAFNNDPVFLDWLRVQLDTKGTMYYDKAGEQARLKYRCHATRKSGDQNTSLGNSLLNAFVQIYAMSLQINNIIPLLYANIIAIIILGDDTVIAMPVAYQLNMDQYIVDIARLGLDITIHRRPTEEVSFCSADFIPANVDGRETRILTQRLTRNIMRSYTSHIHYQSKRAVNWVYTNAVAYMKDFAHVPCMMAYHQNIRDKYPTAKLIMVEEDYMEKHITGNNVIKPSTHLDDWLTTTYHLTNTEIKEMLNMYIVPDVMINRDIYQLNIPGVTATLPNNYNRQTVNPIPHINANTNDLQTYINVHDTSTSRMVRFDLMQFPWINEPRLYHMADNDNDDDDSSSDSDNDNYSDAPKNPKSRIAHHIKTKPRNSVGPPNRKILKSINHPEKQSKHKKIATIVNNPTVNKIIKKGKQKIKKETENKQNTDVHEEQKQDEQQIDDKQDEQQIDYHTKLDQYIITGHWKGTVDMSPTKTVYDLKTAIAPLCKYKTNQFELLVAGNTMQDHVRLQYLATHKINIRIYSMEDNENGQSNKDKSKAKGTFKELFTTLGGTWQKKTTKSSAKITTKHDTTMKHPSINCDYQELDSDQESKIGIDDVNRNKHESTSKWVKKIHDHSNHDLYTKFDDDQSMEMSQFNSNNNIHDYDMHMFDYVDQDSHFGPYNLGGQVIYMTKHFTTNMLLLAQDNNSKIRYLFGDNDVDYMRNYDQQRQHNGGQAKIAGPFDRSSAVGVVTTIYTKYQHPRQRTQMLTQLLDKSFVKISKLLKDGYTISVPAPCKDDPKTNKPVPHGVRHNLGTNIANMSKEELLDIQRRLDAL